MMHHRIPALILGLCTLLGALAPTIARGDPSYPRTALYVFRLDLMTEAEQDTASRHDLIVTSWDSPQKIAEFRGRNPDLRFIFRSNPMYSIDYSSDLDYWYPDTTWSLLRLVEYYALQNDWYLKTTAGDRIPAWDQWLMNWTPYCPKGTYGTSVGLTYAEWLASVAMPQIMRDSPDWEPWGWGSSAFDGIHFELLVDCMGSLAGVFQGIEDADPDEDGLAEGTSHMCSQGGDQDSLSILMRETNNKFYEDFVEAMGDDFPFIMNMNTEFAGPSWRTEAWGIKVERWLDANLPWQDWWDWFYGFRDYSGTELWGPGYQYVEENYRQTPDDRTGWDLSMLEVYMSPSWSFEQKEKWIRYGMGTALLGDGYFYHTYDTDEDPAWHDLYNLDLGLPVEDYIGELSNQTSTLRDTVYTRRFTKGLVMVNPQSEPVDGIAAQDAYMGLWYTLADLEVENVEVGTTELAFTVPDGAFNQVDGFELRVANFPLTAENWDDAAMAPGSPFDGNPGERLHIILSNLSAEMTYYAAIRNILHDRQDPSLSNVVSWQGVPSDEDDTPPGAPGGFMSPGQGANWVTLRWTAPGDDGMEGQAQEYEIRYLVGRTIVTQFDWNIGIPVYEGIPVPGVPGTEQNCLVEGLQPETAYGFAVRAYDEERNEGLLTLPLLVSTRSSGPPPDITAPSAIHDLAATDSSQAWINLQWTAPGDDGMIGRAQFYRLRIVENGVLESEVDWAYATPIEDNLPVPALAGELEFYCLTDLAPGTTYGVAVRAVDDAGLMGALSSPLAAHTLPEPVPPDTLRPEIIIDLQVTDRGEDWLDLAWTAPADPPESDTVQNYYLAYRPGDPLVTEIDWITSNVISNGLPEPSAPGSPEQYRLTGLDPGIFYGISLRTDDAAGNLSHLSPPFADSTMAEPPPPPPPDTLPPYPIDDLAVLYRDTTSVILEWTVPQDQGGSSLASYEIRLSVSSDPIDETTWPSATPYPSSPLPHEPATQQTISWKGLEPGTSYAAAVKTRDMQGNLSELSNPLVFETDTLYIPPEVDETPPSRVDDFRVVSVLTDGFRLLWTMTGDDGMEGLADSMAVALTAGDTPIEDEAAWMGAAKLQDLPSIEPPGTEMQFDLSGLEPESAYALAIRVFDEAGNVSPMSPPLVHRTLALPDTMDPEPIIDLTLAAVGTTFVQLEWTAPGDPDGELQRYILGWKFGDWEPSLRAWELAAKDSTSLPAPSPPGSLETVRLEGLLPDTTYSFQIRCRDAADHLSEEGTVLTIETLPLEDPPDPPDDPPPPGPITDLSLADVGLDWMILTWSAPPDSGDLIISYVLGIYPGSPIEDEAGWESALHLTEGLPPPAPEGAVQSVRIDDISLKNGSGVALRALFNEDSLTALANPLWIDPQTQPPEDPEPPAAVDDLHILSIGPEELVLEWTAPHPGLHGGDVISYELGISPEMITEESWDLVEKIEDPPLPAAPGTMQDWWVGDLTEGTLYIFALKSRSEDLLWSPLSNLLTLTTPQIDAVPPLPPSTLNVQWLEEDLLLLEWPPVNDPYLTGYHVYQRLGAGEFMRVTVEPVSAPRLELTAPTADAPVLYAVTSVNRWGLESALSEETMLYTDAFRLMCPRPHPARASARFQLSLPPAPGGNVQLQAAVYTLSGRRLFMLWNGPVRAGREIELIWDGLSESGRPVTPGFYLLRVRAGNDVRGMKFLLIE